MTGLTGKRKLMFTLYALYITFILITIMPYIAEQELSRGTLSGGVYESHLSFPKNGTYGHYESVILYDNKTSGKIDLQYTFESNTLLIENLENIKELVIDCQLMYKNKCQEVFEKDPAMLEDEYYKEYFKEKNNGLFSVVINTDQPLDKLQFIDAPMPKRVLVNKNNWWETETGYYSVSGNDITITHIPNGNTRIDIYFKIQGKNPIAYFTADKYIAVMNERISFDGSDSSDDDGQIVEYNWDWGDGTKGDGVSPTHLYLQKGTYTVTLTVIDDDELENTFYRTIKIVSEDTDTDSDYVPDNLDPNPVHKADTDGDSLSDDYEEIVLDTDKNKRDSDGDGWDDNVEIEKGTDPNNIDSHPEEKEEGGGFKVSNLMLILILLIILAVVAAGVGLSRRRKSAIEEEDEEEEAEKEAGEDEVIYVQYAPGPPAPEEMPEETAEMPKEVTKSIVKGPPKTEAAVPEAEPAPEPEQAEQAVTTTAAPMDEEVVEEIEEFECPECGATVAADATVCPECGVEFEEDEEVIEEEEFECPDCGATVAADATTCPTCGAEFEE